MTYMELESLEDKAQIKNDYDKGYDDCMKGVNAEVGGSAEYYDGYSYAYNLQEKQSNGSN
jgi:hypothetical protein